MIVISVLTLIVAVILLRLGVEPVPTWFYVFAWYPTLLLLNELARRGERGPLRQAHWPAILSAWAWSAPVWLFFELFNFRLQNWYYVFLPRHGVERWTGIVLSFATVVPAVLLAERALRAWGVGRRWITRPFPLGDGGLLVAMTLGAGMMALSWIAPVVFFPLVWGGMLLLCEPYVYRHRPDLSLFADLTRGEWGRVGRLLLGGAGIGLLWEGYNYWARGKWIYTVPWLEELKLFEMPPFGFVGFPFFALEAWAMYHALCTAGLARPLDHPGEIRPGRLIPAALITVLFSILILSGMERHTNSSVYPAVEELPWLTSDEQARLRERQITSAFELATAQPATLAAAGLPPAKADSVIDLARLAVLRGIGGEHAFYLGVIGVNDPCALSRRTPLEVWNRLQPVSRPGTERPTPAEVRVWHRAATRSCPDRFSS